MLILAVDTSGRNGSLALARGEGDSADILDIAPLEGGQYSAQLIPTFAAMLERHNLVKEDIDAYAVAVGPGSFTGLRVGIAAVKALADVFNKPVAGVSVLEAVATSTRDRGSVIAALDAGRKEVYAGEYVHSSHVGVACAREALLAASNFIHLLDINPHAPLITPDVSVAELVPFHTRITQIERPQADTYARLGLVKIAKGEATPVEKLEANYIRRSDAELARG